MSEGEGAEETELALGLGLGSGLGFDFVCCTNSIPGSNSVDGVCDFKSVPPDQLYPNAKKRITGSRDLTQIHAHTQGHQCLSSRTDPCSYARASRLDADQDFW